MPRIVTVTLNPALDLSTETAEVRPNRKLRCAPPRRDPGGGGVNVSRAIAKLGGASLCAVAAGGDAGAALLALLAAEGVEARDLGLDLPTRQSLAVTDLASGDQFRFVMPGPVWSAADLDRALALVVGWCAAGDWLVPSGSLPEGVPPDTFPKLGARLAGKGVRMVLDTSGAALVAAAEARGLALLRMDDAEAEALGSPGGWSARASRRWCRSRAGPRARCSPPPRAAGSAARRRSPWSARSARATVIWRVSCWRWHAGRIR